MADKHNAPDSEFLDSVAEGLSLTGADRSRLRVIGDKLDQQAEEMARLRAELKRIEGLGDD